MIKNQNLYKKPSTASHMNILPGIKIIDKALWLPHERILIIADLHIGYEEYLNSQGVLAPRVQFEEMKKEIDELMCGIKPKTIVLNGDLKHEFGKISDQEWSDTFRIMKILSENCQRIILIKGNHDNILEPIIRSIGKRKIRIAEEYIVKDICILHGHKLNYKIENKIRRIKILIIAHEHPAVSLKDGIKSETFKCFLLGRWKDKKLIVMPSFIPLVEGTDIKKEKTLSPFLKRLENFEVFIVSDKVYEFGKLGKIRLLEI